MKFSATTRKLRNAYVIATQKQSIKNNIIQLMRISFTTVFLLIVMVSAMLANSLKGQSITTQKVTIGFNKQSLETAIKQIQQQSSFNFFYRKADIKSLSKLSLPNETRTISQTLEQLLKNTFFTFRQVDHNVYIEKLGQANFEINGRILDVVQRAVAFATVKIARKENNQVIQSTQTDTAGYFKLTCTEKGNYLLTVTALSMDSLTVAFSLNTNPVVTIPDLVLTANIQQLKQVNIVGKRPYIEQQIDRTVVNINALIANTGSNALEVLQRSPGITVDPNGRISFKGKAGVLVLINDKPTYLSGDNLAAYLRSMPAEQLDQIELISSPPAKYDAAGNAGVINIKTIKSKALGLKGNVSASVGKAQYWRTQQNISLNYNTERYNMLLQGGYSLQNDYRRLDVVRNYFNSAETPTSIYNETAFFKTTTKNPNLKLAFDYYLSPQTTLGIVLTGSLSTGSTLNPVTSTIRLPNGVLDSTIIATNATKSQFNTGGINLNYTHQYQTKGQNLTFDLDYLTYKTSRDQTFYNTSYSAAGNVGDIQNITNNLPNLIHIYAAKTDYVQPLKGKAKVETGLKSSYVNTDNAANYFNVVNNVSTVNNGLTNRFLYKENINAGYISFTEEFKRFAIKAGVRIENTNVNAHQFGNAISPDSAFTRHYTNVFPTAYLSYKLDTTGANNLKVSYGRRIDRPYYQDLNPFVSIIDKYSYFVGNTLLRPQFSDNYNLTYSFKSIFNLSFDYSDITDFQSEVDSQIGSVFSATTLNLGKSIHKSIGIYFAIMPAKWWNFNINAQAINNIYQGKINGTVLNVNSTYFFGNINNGFILGKGWNAELAVFYQSKGASSQFVINGLGQVNTGIQKKILNDKGTIKLGVNDLFRNNLYRSAITNIPGVTANIRNDQAVRRVSVSFTYSFGSSQSKQRRDTQSAESEKSRVKN